MLNKCLLAMLFFIIVISNPGLSGTLDPLGNIHIPIGIPDSLDTLKTFVESEGIFSPDNGRKCSCPGFTANGGLCRQEFLQGVGGMQQASRICGPCRERWASPFRLTHFQVALFKALVLLRS